MFRSSNDVYSERRLKPIYDSLDLGNYRRALQECEKLLKKHPDFTVAKALKALANIRLKKVDVARALIGEIDCSKVTDHLAVQALTYCFRELDDSDNLVKLYQSVTKNHPNSEDFLFQLTLSYGRIGEFKMMSLSAMHLNKLRPGRSLYYFWSILCHLLQTKTEPELASSMHLPLAVRMTEKYFSNPSNVIKPQYALLYLYLLQKQNRWEDVIEFLCSKKCPNHASIEQVASCFRLEALQKLAKYNELWDECKRRLTHKPTDTTAWVYMIKTVVQLVKKDKADDSVIKNTLKFMDDQVNAVAVSEKSFIRSRSQQLARIVFYSEMFKESIFDSEAAADSSTEFINVIAVYFEHFASKACMFRDLEAPFVELERPIQLKMIEAFTSFVGQLPLKPIRGGHVDFAVNSKEACRHASLLELCISIDYYDDMTIADRQLMAHQCRMRFFDALSASVSSDSRKSEYILAADKYLMVTVAHLWELFIQTGDDECLHTIAALLNEGIRSHKDNPVFKVMLVKVYSVLGAPSRLCDAFNKLEAKYILAESVWYLLVSNMSCFGFFKQFNLYTVGCVEFYFEAVREMTDCFLMAMKCGVYLRALDGFWMLEILRSSAHRRLMSIDQLYFKLLIGYDTFEAARNDLRTMFESSNVFMEQHDWSELIDNRDFTLVPYLGGKKRKSDFAKYNQQMFNVLIYRGKYHLSMLQLFKHLFALNRLTQATTDAPGRQISVEQPNFYGSFLVEDVTNKALQDALKCVCSLKEMVSVWRAEKPKFTRHFALYGSSPCYFLLALDGHYPDIVLTVTESCVQFMQFVILLINYSKARDAASADGAHSLPDMDDIFPNTENFQLDLRAMFSMHQFSEKTTDFFPYMQTVHIAFLIETFLLSALACSSVNYLFILLRGELVRRTRKKNKKRHTAVDCALLQGFKRFDAFVRVIVLAGKTVHRMISDMQTMLDLDLSNMKLNDEEIDDQKNQKHWDDKNAKNMYSKLCISYKVALEELSGTYEHLQNILDHLSTSDAGDK